MPHTGAPVPAWAAAAAATLALLTAGCTTTVGGQGLPAAASADTSVASPSQSASPSTTDSAPPSTATSSSTATGAPPTSTSPPTTSAGTSVVPTDPNDPDAVLAFQTAELFVQRIDAGDAAGAYELLCPELQADITVEDFISVAPPPGYYTFTPVGQLGPGEYLGQFAYEDETDDVLIRADGTGQYCLGETGG